MLSSFFLVICSTLPANPFVAHIHQAAWMAQAAVLNARKERVKRTSARSLPYRSTVGRRKNTGTCEGLLNAIIYEYQLWV